MGRQGCAGRMFEEKREAVMAIEAAVLQLLGGLDRLSVLKDR
jgi:hypothetical protein